MNVLLHTFQMHEERAMKGFMTKRSDSQSPRD
jgi:hypothetical protein